MKKTITVFAVVAILIPILLCSCSDTKNKDNSTVAEETQYPFYQTDEKTYIIETKYADLVFPTKWKDSVKVEISDEDLYTVSFLGETENGDVKLFDISFGDFEGNKLGTMAVDGQTIDVYLDTYGVEEILMTEDEYNDCCAMEEAVNVVISGLINDYGLKFD